MTLSPNSPIWNDLQGQTVFDRLHEDIKIAKLFAQGAAIGESRALKIQQDNIIYKEFGSQISVARRLNHKVALVYHGSLKGFYELIRIELKEAGWALAKVDNNACGSYDTLIPELDNLISKAIDEKSALIDKAEEVATKEHYLGNFHPLGDREKQIGALARIILAAREYRDMLRKENELRIIRQLQELTTVHLYAAKGIKAERLRRGRDYLEQVDNYLDVLRRFAHKGVQ